MSDHNDEQRDDRRDADEGARIVPIESYLDEAREDGDHPQEAPEEYSPDADDEGVEAGELSRIELKLIIEALLFATAKPLAPRLLAQHAGMKDARSARAIVEELAADYESQGRAFAVEEVAGGFQLMSRPEFRPWVERLRNKERNQSLSQSALETLAIIAYRQPITRAEIEDIRGVQSGYILRSLIEKALVRITGRSEDLGRPLLYGTTNVFLEVFGLASLRDLPRFEGLEAQNAE